MEPTSVEGTLGWQQTTFEEILVNGREFMDQAVQLQHFGVFALMRVNSPYITLCHSVQFFLIPPGMPQKGDKEQVGFVGGQKDR